MRRVKNGLVVLVLVAVLFVGACGAPSGAAEAAQSAQAQGVEVIEKQPGGDLFIAMPAAIESFDPLIAQSEDLINLLTLIYETPLKYSAAGKLENNLVEKWEVNDAKTEFTFTLRDDVYFSDGVTKLTADDILYSAGQVLALTGQTLNAGAEDAATGEEELSPSPSGSPDAGASAPQDGEPEASPSPGESGLPQASPDTNGGEAETLKRRYQQYNGYVTAMEKIDERTVKLTMSQAGNAGLHFMTFPVMNSVLADGDTPVGTGSYKVDSYISGDKMVLTVNQYWWKDTPYLEKIVANAVTGNKNKLEMEESSLLDFITTDVLYSGKYQIAGKTRVIDYMTNYYDCLIPNLMTDELKDVHVRQAISYAVDRREILSTVLLNHGVPTNLPIAPDFYAYDSKYKISDYDVRMAKDFLAQAGYRTEPDGEGQELMLTMIVPDERESTYKKEAAKAIRKQLAEVGITVEIEELEEEDYMTRLAGGNFDLAYCSYYMDIVPDLSFMFEGGESGNYGHVQSADITDAIAVCRAAVSEEEIIKAYGELQRVLTERVPQIGLYYRMNSIICDESIQDIKELRQNEVFANVAEWYNSYFAHIRIVDATQEPVPSASPEQEEGVSASSAASVVPASTETPMELPAVEESPLSTEEVEDMGVLPGA